MFYFKMKYKYCKNVIVYNFFFKEISEIYNNSLYMIIYE